MVGNFKPECQKTEKHLRARSSAHDTLAVTTDLLCDLIASAHAQGITAMDLAATIDHHGHILLIIQPGLDFIDHSWQTARRPGPAR